MGNRSSLLLIEEEIAQIQLETGCKFKNYVFNNVVNVIFSYPQPN